MSWFPDVGVKPYYEDDAVVIFHGDCREILPLLPEATVDLVLTDTDYNSQYILYDWEDSKPADDEYREWCNEWFTMVRTITSNIVFTPGTLNIWNYPPARWVAAWHKSSSPAKSRLGGFAVWEPILISGDMKCKFGHDYLNYEPRNFGTQEWDTQHPCPKNPECWKTILSRVEGEVILDPFLGSGTTARVAKDLGRKSIGIERSEHYCEIAAKRMAQTVMAL